MPRLILEVFSDRLRSNAPLEAVIVTLRHEAAVVRLRRKKHQLTRLTRLLVSAGLQDRTQTVQEIR